MGEVLCLRLPKAGGVPLGLGRSPEAGRTVIKWRFCAYAFKDAIMPFVTITVSQPLSADQKKQLLQASSDTIVEALQTSLPSVRIVLQELPAGHYLNGGKFDTFAVEYKLDMIEGRSEQLKAAAMRELSRTAHRVIGVSEAEVRVRMTDFPKTDIGVANGVSAKAAGR